VRRRSTLSLLSLTRTSTLRLCTRALREPTSGTAIEPASLRRGTAASLRSTRSTRTNAADVLRARTLRVRLERSLRRRSRSARAKALLVLLVPIQRLAVVRRGEDADAAETAAQLMRVAVRVRVVAQLLFLVRLLVLLAVQALALALSVCLRLLARWASGTRRRAWRKDGVFDESLRWDAVGGIVVRIAVVLVLWIGLIITHGRRVALSALLSVARRRCGPALLLLRLLRLLLLLLLEGRQPFHVIVQPTTCTEPASLPLLLAITIAIFSTAESSKLRNRALLGELTKRSV